MKKFYLLTLIIFCLVSNLVFAGDFTAEADYINYSDNEFKFTHSFSAKKQFSIFAFSAGAQAFNIDLERIRMFPLGFHVIAETDNETVNFIMDVSAKYVLITDYENKMFYVTKGFIKIPVTDAEILIGCGYQSNNIYDGVMLTIGIKTVF